MPNINLLNTISTTTVDRSYFVMSDNGLARRYKLENLITAISSTIPGSNRTDQNLFTTTDVTFGSVNLMGPARTTTNPVETSNAFQSNFSHGDGSGIKTNDVIGEIRFGGYDGRNNTILDNALSSAGFTAVASQDWQYNGNTTTNAASGFALYHQPVDTRLSSVSRVLSFTVSSTSTTQPISVVKIGSMPTQAASTNISTDGTRTYTGPGAAYVEFFNSKIFQVGLPSEDNSPVNATLTSTNYYGFVTGRHNTFIGTRGALTLNDTIGITDYRGITQTLSGLDIGESVASVRAYATCNFSPSNKGGGYQIRTRSSSTNAVNITSMDIRPEKILYTANEHNFSSLLGTATVTINNGTVIFSDNTVQATAYQGFTSVPASSSSTGTRGQMAYDASYFYICVAENTWKRIQASDF